MTEAEQLAYQKYEASLQGNYNAWHPGAQQDPAAQDPTNHYQPPNPAYATPTSPYGANPYYQNVTGASQYDGTPTSYNSNQFATPEVAEQIARAMGGQVVAGNQDSLAGQPNVPQYYIQMPSGEKLNAGLVADMYNHGYSQSYINQQMSQIASQQGGKYTPPTPPVPTSTNTTQTGTGTGTKNPPMKVGGSPSGTADGSYNFSPNSYAQTGQDDPFATYRFRGQTSTDPKTAVPRRYSYNPVTGTQQPSTGGTGTGGTGTGGGTGGSGGTGGGAGTPQQPAPYTPPPRYSNQIPSGQSYGAPADGSMPQFPYSDPYGYSDGAIPWSDSVGNYGDNYTGPQFRNDGNLGNLIQNDRLMAYGRGGELNADFLSMQRAGLRRANVMGTQGDQASAYMMRNPGYNADEQDAIMGTGYYDAQGNYVPGRLDSLQQTQQEAQDLYLTDAERQAMMGNPDNIRAAFSQGAQDNMMSTVHDTAKWQRNILNTADSTLGDINSRQANELNDAVDPGRLGVSSDYQNTLTDILGNTRTNVNNALNYNNLGQRTDTEGKVMGSAGQYNSRIQNAVDDPNLGLSADYIRDHRFSPEDQQAYVNQAARTAGNQTRALQDQIQQQASAAGNVSPLAIAAATNRARYTGEMSGENAMNDARVRAKQLGLDVAQQSEATRLGATQTQANMKATNAQTSANRDSALQMDLEQQRIAAAQGAANLGTSAQQALGNQQLAGATGYEQMRMGGEQDISSRRMSNANSKQAAQAQSAQYLANQRVGVEQAAGNQDIAAQQYLMNTGIGIEQGIDASQASRANAVATNRQATAASNQNTRYTRGQYADQQLSSRGTTVGNARRQDFQAGLTDIRNQQGQAYQNMNTAGNQRVATFGAQTSATNAAEANALTQNQTPGLFEKVIGGVTGAVGAIGGAATGKIVTRPTYLTIAEKQPEVVVPLKRPRYGKVA